MIGLALLITLVSAIALNWGYLREHEAAGTLPTLSIRRPLRTARLLLANRRWLTGFAAETAGWGLFVLALALAPLALVQAASAGGIGILAALVSRFRLTKLARRERLGVGLSVAGLGLLGVSLTGGVGEGSEASWLALGLWLAASVVVAGLIAGAGWHSVHGGPAFGAATGVMFAAGDVATKATVAGDIALAPVVIAAYGAGTLLLQMGFQRGGALVTAGVATLLTNAVPIAAGMTIFHEPLPRGAFGVVRIVAFAAVVVSAIVLARKAPDTGEAREPTLGRRDGPGDVPTRVAAPAPVESRGTPTIQRRDLKTRRLGAAVAATARERIGLPALGSTTRRFSKTRRAVSDRHEPTAPDRRRGGRRQPRGSSVRHPPAARRGRRDLRHRADVAEPPRVDLVRHRQGDAARG